MRIGIPKEIKTMEGRVGLIPAAVAELVRAGHTVWVEHDAGRLSGYDDDRYEAAGARIAPDAASLYEQAQLIVKIKEPVGKELEYLRPDHLLFSFLHLAAAPQLARRLQDIGLTAVAFETVTDSRGQLPLLAPMSDIAGRLATQIGCRLLHQSEGGKGLLLGGLSGARRGRVVILGAGNAGGGAAALAAPLGAEVIVFDRDRARLQAIRRLGHNVTALFSYDELLREEVGRADLLIGAVLVPGARTPHLVSADMVRAMEPGSVVMDISVDQGGCIETTRPTTHADPVLTWEGVLHFGVTNMPGTVPHSASQAMSAVLTPYVLALAAPGWEGNPGLAAGVNVRNGRLVHPAVAEAVGNTVAT
ncbi:MAG TPA: alanine dehydrogenase [Gammaproteobacteria bacterium]|nr:alanine dehydrogenase [Gammaproteobacteria bacterium]